MKCLLVTTESAEVLFYWTDQEFEQNIKKQYGTSQEESGQVRFRFYIYILCNGLDRKRDIFLIHQVICSQVNLQFYFLSLQPLQIVSTHCLPQSSSRVALWLTDWETATPLLARKMVTSMHYIR